ncbi:MFS transporter [Streptomyces sp. RTd22]|uniref:MFS transporter n=1 Tax=Streptomyces sp. RTd22 TaxID=1841249 RepID=UPI000AEC6F0B
MSGQSAADVRGSASSGPEAGDNRPRQGLRSTVLVACLAFFVITLDTTVVNVALPSIGQQWGGQVSALQWVVTAYTLLFAALLLSAGAISDRIGASRAFTIGLSVFTLMSALCGLAPNLTVLITARAIQGAGAAVMMPASLALVRQAYDSPAQRARGIALWTAGGGAAVAAGPVVGGALTTGLGAKSPPYSLWPPWCSRSSPEGRAGGRARRRSAASWSPYSPEPRSSWSNPGRVIPPFR